ncbi:cupin domain-containing protein [Terriglobus roseus DSM 18391]|uniref:Cupin domain-containing protein n=2 Tax=Terriglobus roseus TaxID=392734 RepID=I3ZM83_TERRK|nr:cupin domain-containing protein [Terriglobus roseus DSM 18391]
MERMSQGQFFDIAALAATLPATAETMLRDIRLTDEAAASCRIFRVYRPAPLHFHTACDEYLYVLQGRGRIQIEDAVREVGPGDLIHFKVRVVHGTPEILEHPFVFLAIDTPRRPPDDVHFVNPADGNASTFIASQEY